MYRYHLRGLVMPLSFDLHSGLNTIGRNHTNDFWIPDVSISSFHCEINVTEGGVVVRDLESTNGVFINDEPVKEASLRPGQVLQLGTVTLRLEVEEIQVRVPTLPVPEPPAPIPRLPDGRLACTRNPELAATHQCPKCERAFHRTNLRGLTLSGSRTTLLFCPDCDGQCVPIAGAEERKAKKSFLTSLTQKIHTRWRPK